MIMTKDEIVRDCKAAKAPQKQIGILADLNASSKKEIVEILREAGCELPAYYTKKPKETPEQTKEAVIKAMKDAPLVLEPAPAQEPKTHIAPETLTALTKAKVAFSDAVRAMLPEFDDGEDFEDLDKELFFERVIGMVVMLDALERRERRSQHASD